ncbi:MAG: hypothetical protein R3236_06415 [Phycisphaeraceae bacterium]|nr:hypothetical protein [Phycisphaeraceae bacterium]
MNRRSILICFLLLGPAVAIPAAETAELKNLRVGGVRLINFEDKDNGIRPFNWSAGLTMSLVGELPEAALAVQKGELTEAVADNGKSLLREKKWDRRISFPKLSKDRKQVVFQAKMVVPGPDVRGLKRLSGTLTYLTSTGTKEQDLGTMALKKGTKGPALGAEVVSVAPSKWRKGKQELKLKLAIEKETIKQIQFLDADGKPLAFKKSGSMSTKDWVQLGFTAEKFPDTAKIKLTLHDNLKKKDLRFTLRNVTLTGRPLKK